MADDSNPRARLYTLLGRLFLDELDRPLALYLRELPGLAEHIPPDAALDAWLADLRAEHQQLFGLNVYPYESIFRDRELMLNTAATQRVGALYQACGFRPAARLRAGAPDHLGIELHLMAELSARAAHEQGARVLAARLLHQHLAAWLPACAEAIRRVARAPLYGALAAIATELTLADLEEFAPPPAPRTEMAPDGEAPAPQAGETAAELRTGEEYALQAIMRQLLTPDEVGVFISRSDISAISRTLELAAPIAERETMLFGLFSAAGRFDQVPALLDALGGLLRQADAAYAQLAATHPAWAAHGRAWRARTAAGQALLAEMATQATEEFARKKTEAED